MSGVGLRPGRRVRRDGQATVDVVMPFFNHGMFVEEAVESARSQSTPVSEIIIVDDGSTDENSLKALERLEDAGITVLRQERSGPGAARNLGVGHSTADAVLFLDSDDRIGKRFVATALAALAASPDDVGYAYPDQQFFGNRLDLAVMPSYNLYLLGTRNFVGTGSVIDRSVFDAGHLFRPQLVHGHEDWDYFLTLGGAGIFGIGFHEEPLYVRKWGYSRADSVDDTYGVFLDEIRGLHPDLFAADRLVDIKRRWSPALSVLAEWEPSLAEQTCADFEVLALAEGAEIPEPRGRWVVLIDPEAGMLADPTCIERIIRLQVYRPAPSVIGFSEAEGSGLVPWQQMPENPEKVVAVCMDGASFARWRSDAPAGAGLAEVLLAESVGRQMEWRWAPRREHAAGASARFPVAIPVPADPPPPDQSEAQRQEALANYGSNRGQGGRSEEAFRWSTGPVIFPSAGLRRTPAPPLGHTDGVRALVERAWGGWVPTQTQRLDLVVRPNGSSYLEPVHDRGQLAAHITTPPGATRLAIGRIWVRPFPGTACLYSVLDVRTHALTYRVSEGPPAGRHEVPLGYVLVAPLSDVTSLREAVSTALAASKTPGSAPVKLEVETPGDFIEQIAGGVSDGWAPGGALALRTSARGAARRWPLFELTIDDGRFRYATHPDECVWRPDTARPSCSAVAAVLGYDPARGGATLHEVRYRGTEGTGYVSGPAELAAGKDVLDSVRVLGMMTEIPGETVPLIRLRPSGARTPPPGEPGHRLAADWLSLEQEDYEPEGAVGFVTTADSSLAPLYRWRDPAGFAWRLTLGEPPQDQSRSWVLEGTLGSAWYPSARKPDQAELWEMEAGDLVTYATRPEEFEAEGFVATRVVARVLLHRTPGCVPLFRLARDGNRPWLFSPCSAELSQEGFAAQGIVGFLEPSVPPASGDSAEGELPGWGTPLEREDGRGSHLSGVASARAFSRGVRIAIEATDGAIVVGGHGSEDDALAYAADGPVPFGLPIYHIRNRVSSDYRFVCAPSEDPMDDVEDVVGYLWSPRALAMWPECNASPGIPPTANPRVAGRQPGSDGGTFDPEPVPSDIPGTRSRIRSAVPPRVRKAARRIVG